MVNLRDVAAAAGVSPAVASAAISGGSSNIRMSPTTRKRVLDAAQKSGYRVNHAARSLRTARTGVINAVVPKIANPVFEHVVRGAHDQVTSTDGILMLTDADWLTPDSHLLSRLAARGMTDGFLVRRAQLGDDTIDALQSMQVPCVVLSGPDGVHPSIWVDDRAGIRLATTHLLELGHRRIALVGGLALPARAQDSRQRGLSEAFESAGATPSSDLHRPVGYALDDVREATRAMLALADRPTAIITDNVTSAVAAYSAIAEAGLRIPDDVSVVGYHDVASAAQLWPALTTVRMPLHEVGVQAARMLQGLIEGEPGESVLVRGAELVVRDSTAQLTDRPG